MRTHSKFRSIQALAAIILTAAAIAANTGQIHAAGVSLSGAESDAGNSMLILSAITAVLAIGVGAALGAVGGFILRRKPRE